MPKAYMVFTYTSISDPQKLANYGKLAIPAVAPFGARMLARGTAAAAYENGLKERVTIVEFPSLEKALAARECSGYQEALKALGDGGHANDRRPSDTDYQAVEVINAVALIAREWLENVPHYRIPRGNRS